MQIFLNFSETATPSYDHLLDRYFHKLSNDTHFIDIGYVEPDTNRMLYSNFWVE